MVSWLYGLLLGLGIASGILAFGALMAGVLISVEASVYIYEKDAKPYKIISIICFSLLPVFIIASVVLLSITLSVGKI